MKTLILFQVPVCARFFILSDLEDFGVFRSHPNSDNGGLLPIPEIKTPFYAHRAMKSLTSLLRDLKRASDRRIGPYAFIQHRRRQRRYLADLRRYARELDAGTRFAYFPLHMQPEMTTSAIGGIYVDQLLAIERLSRRLPPDMKIVVKENPKQTAYQRPHSFFERLAAIPNAQLVPSDRDTYQLIRESEFRCYSDRHRRLGSDKPGEAHARVRESLVRILARSQQVQLRFGRAESWRKRKVDKLEVEHAYRDLMGRAYPGIISSPYFKLSPGLDIEKNNALVAAALKKAISNDR